MKIKKVLTLNEEDTKSIQHFRAEVLHPMCDLLENHCELCPFNDMGCSDLEDFLTELCEKGEWVIPTRER